MYLLLNLEFSRKFPQLRSSLIEDDNSNPSVYDYDGEGDVSTNQTKNQAEPTSTLWLIKVFYNLKIAIFKWNLKITNLNFLS
jgi:hypothetical protein